MSHTGHAFDDGREIGLTLLRILSSCAVQYIFQITKAHTGSSNVIVDAALCVVVSDDLAGCGIGYACRIAGGRFRISWRLKIAWNNYHQINTTISI